MSEHADEAFTEGALLRAVENQIEADQVRAAVTHDRASLDAR
jgi:hypothetical protein